MPPGTRNALVPPSPNYLRDAGEFTGGLLRGSSTALMGGLQMRDQLALDAYRSQQAGSLQGVYADAWRAAQEAAANPSMITDAVGNSLRGMWTRAKSGPAGLGEVVGENIDPRNWLKPRKALRHELDVYHGTPHTFDPETGAPLGRFRSEKIGTGEGAQAYGYGLYFAEDPSIAGYYKRMDSPFAVGGLKGVPATVAALAKQDAPGGPANAAKFLRDNYDSYAKQWGKQEVDTALKSLESGSLYKVDLPDAKIEQMLDWDKPLSQQHPNVIAAIKSLHGKDALGRPLENPQPLSMDSSGQWAYQNIQDGRSQRLASEALQKAGIPGIRYLDNGSRAGEKGTRNFVVFPGEEQHLNILSRD